MTLSPDDLAAMGEGRVTPETARLMLTDPWARRFFRYAHHDADCFEGLTRGRFCSCGLDALIKRWTAEEHWLKQQVRTEVMTQTANEPST